MEKKTYKYILISLKSDSINLLNELNQVAVSEFGCNGVEEFSLIESEVDHILGERAYSGGDIPESLLDEVDETVKSTETSTYKYFFYEGDIDNNINEFKAFLDDNISDFSFTYDEFIADWEDWNTSWRKHYSVVKVSEDIQIVPEWSKEKYRESDHQNIYIYPGMGFGTGEHETTSLCLKLFDNVKAKFNDKDSCLDFGCGSGILGIAAIKFSKMTAVFCDIDSNALDNSVQNIELNFPGEDLAKHRLVIRDRYKIGEKRYELIFANILEHVLFLERDMIIESLEKNGYLILSGLLNPQVLNIKENYSEELIFIETISSGDWSAMLFQKK